MVKLTNELNKLPRDIIGYLHFFGKTADSLGYPACVVGGFVRDFLLGVENFDLDIVVEGDGINFAKELNLNLGGHLVMHKRFKTATVAAKDGKKIDVATARGELYEYPASLPKITPGSIKDDLSRRDFSINALAFSINKERFGELIDFFNGREDLVKKKVRVLHDLSFIDDPTRILRAIRFEQRYNFKITPHTLNLIKEALKIKILLRIQKQRLRNEIILLLKENHPLKCIKRLNKICGFGFIHPKIKLSVKKISLLSKIDEISQWFHEVFPNKRRIELWLVYLMVLLEDLEKNNLCRVINEFAFSKGEKLRILSFVRDADNVISKLKRPMAPSRIYRILEPLSYEVIILVMLKAKNSKVKENIRNFLHHYNEVKIFSNGEDLKSLGIDPGPRYKEILDNVLYAKLDKKLNTKEEELLYLKDKIQKQYIKDK